MVAVVAEMRVVVEVVLTQLLELVGLGHGVVTAGEVSNGVEAEFLVEIQEEDEEEHHKGSDGPEERCGFHRHCGQEEKGVSG